MNGITLSHAHTDTHTHTDTQHTYAAWRLLAMVSRQRAAAANHSAGLLRHWVIGRKNLRLIKPENKDNSCSQSAAAHAAEEGLLRTPQAGALVTAAQQRHMPNTQASWRDMHSIQVGCIHMSQPVHDFRAHAEAVRHCRALLLAGHTSRRIPRQPARAPSHAALSGCAPAHNPPSASSCALHQTLSAPSARHEPSAPPVPQAPVLLQCRPPAPPAAAHEAGRPPL